MFKTSAILATDFYKIGHVLQYPENTTLVYSNLTPRSNRLTICHESPFYDGKMVVFGIQYFIKHFIVDLFNETFFLQPIEKICKEYQSRIIKSLNMAIGLDHIRKLHALGYLPVHIKALPEGSRVSMKTPILTIVNTLPEFYWVTNFLETALSAEIWKLCNNATIAFEYKRIFTHYANKTCDNLDHVQYQGHDFSMRGMSGIQDAMASGMAHLTSFMGTDCIPAIEGIEYYYPSRSDAMIGCSIPATEHSVACSYGKDNEIDMFKRLITEVYPTGMVSIVSDTWDFWKVVTEYLLQLKDIIMARDGKVVIRPDSGDPADIICGSKNYEIIESTDVPTHDYYNGKEIACCENAHIARFFLDIRDDSDHEILYHDMTTNKYYTVYVTYLEIDESCGDLWIDKEYSYVPKGAIEHLWDIFGGTINEKGYKVLDPHIGLIYGDSITLGRANEILNRLEKKGFASSNVVFGIGSYTYNYSTRDCFGMAVKSTYVEIDGVGKEIFKNPKTDSGTKKSAKGLLRVIENADGELCVEEISWEKENTGKLVCVYNDTWHTSESIETIRERLK